MARAQSSISLAIQIAPEPAPAGHRALVVEATNHSAKPVTVVAHARYCTIEVEDRRGQFTRGAASSTNTEIPRPADYLTLAPGTRTAILRTAIERSASSPGAVTIGELSFSDVPDKARVRVTYHAADRVMPNLPRDKQSSFVAGPIEGISLDVW